MKRNRFSLLFLSIGIIISNASALTYNIDFAGSGLSTSVDSVVVQNLTKNTSVVVPIGMYLLLTDVTTGTLNKEVSNSDMSIFPSAEDGKYTLKVDVKEAGSCKIYLFASDGKVISEYNDNLQIGENSFEMSVPKGMYIIKAIGTNYNYSKKIVSQTSTSVRPRITFTNRALGNTVFKSKAANFVLMSYSSGYQLIYSGKSGNYCTLVSDQPIASKTITFEFYECKDKNGKYYAITKIGTQVWMAENLAYLPEAVTIDAKIGSEDVGKSGKPFYYVNDITKYGVLYNWFAAQAAVPDGYHAEWVTLSTYLGGNTVSGGKLKSTSGWTSPNTAATNSSCFSATAGGDRDTNGFVYTGIYGHWWTATPQGPYAYYFVMNNTSGTIQTYADYTILALVLDV